MCFLIIKSRSQKVFLTLFSSSFVQRTWCYPSSAAFDLDTQASWHSRSRTSACASGCLIFLPAGGPLNSLWIGRQSRMCLWRFLAPIRLAKADPEGRSPQPPARKLFCATRRIRRSKNDRATMPDSVSGTGVTPEPWTPSRNVQSS